MNYSLIKRNFDKGLWSAKQVQVAVKKGIITSSEYNAITGVVYISLGKSPVLETQKQVDELTAVVDVILGESSD